MGKYVKVLASMLRAPSKTKSCDRSCSKLRYDQYQDSISKFDTDQNSVTFSDTRQQTL